MVEVPHLRIVSDEQWGTIQARYAAFDGSIRTKKPRPKRLLSGLGKCGECGGTWTVIGPEKWGCSTRKAKGTCSNTRTVSTRLYERRVLGHLKQALLDPEAVALFVSRYNTGIRARQAEASATRTPLERKMSELRARVSRLVDAIAEGAGEFQEVKDRLRAARAEMAEMESQLAALDAAAPIELSFDLADRYRAYIAELDAALATEGIARDKAASAIRELIDSITLSAKADGRGVEIHVEGRMANIINLAKQSG